MRALALSLLTLGLALPALAQPVQMPSVRAPLLVVQRDPGQPGDKVGAKTVDVQVRIVGRLAETRMTLTFGNPHDRALAGDLYLPLPEHATVSGYALDVAGRMVDGVVVANVEARRIFEKEVRKGVDPGLVEWTRGNVFKTRVFPIPANGTRTIMVRWVAPLDDAPMESTVSPADADREALYSLPLGFADPVDLTVRVEVKAGDAAPVASGSGPIALSFGKAFVAEAKVTQKPVVQNLQVRIPAVGRAPVQVEEGDDGRHWFAIQDFVTVVNADAPPPKRLRIVWDASLSRERSDHAPELALVEQLLTGRFPQAEVEVVLLRHEAAAAKVFPAGGAKAVVAFLRTVDYDGGTQLAKIPRTADVDLQLLFSDGLSTFGDEDPGTLGAPTWAFSSSIEAAHDQLSHLAKQSGGAYFDLAKMQTAAVADRVGRPVFSLLSARATAGEVADLVPGGVEPVVGATFVGGRLLSATATIEVQYGVPGGKPQVTRTYSLAKAGAPGGDLIVRAWAERTLSALMASPQRNADRIAALGREHGIVTLGTSLLVLETLEQYVEHGVRPPGSLGEMRAAWDAQNDERAKAEVATVRDRLDQVAAMWGEEVEWYERKFNYPANFRYRDPDSAKKSGRSDTAYGMAGMAPPTATSAPRSPEPAPEAEVDAKSDAADEPSKKPESGKAVAAADPEPGVSLTPWDPQTPYIAALKAAAPAARFEVYLKQRAEFGTAPSFFLDCSDFFLAQKDEALALQVLSNIAELRLGDPALLRVLGHRLAQLEKLDASIRTFEEVLRLRPEEPQSYRDLALVHGRRADQLKAYGLPSYERALGLLADVVKRRWDRFEAIEIMALTEMNALWPRAEAAGARFPLDDRFEKPMELDVRIVMTWDADMTDMDLHVLEPSQEEAYYGHNLTTIGGKVSRDFTQGYGPEVYSVRRAMRGIYKVKTKFYGSSAAQLQGAVTLQIDVFTNWGRKNEKRQSMTLRLTENKEEFVVGEVRF